MRATHTRSVVLGRRAAVGRTGGPKLGRRRSPGARGGVSRDAAAGGRARDAIRGVVPAVRQLYPGLPAGVLSPDLGEYGVASFFSPVLAFCNDYCREDCVRCTESCPSGAIRRLSVADKLTTPVGLARVDYDVCLLSDDRECSACRNHCPFDAVGIVFSEETYTLTVLVDPAHCPGCGACQVACPTDAQGDLRHG